LAEDFDVGRGKAFRAAYEESYPVHLCGLLRFTDERREKDRENDADEGDREHQHFLSSVEFAQEAHATPLLGVHPTPRFGGAE